MIILESQVSSINLDTVVVTVSGPYLHEPYQYLETVDITLTFPMSPSFGLVDLDVVTLTISGPNIPPSTGFTVNLDPAYLVLLGAAITIATRDYGCEINNILSRIRAGGFARATPVRFVDCDSMDVIDALRAGTSLPHIPHEDAECLQNNLLGALLEGSAIPWIVPSPGSWGLDEGQGDAPEVLPAMYDHFICIPNSGSLYMDDAACHFYISGDLGVTWSISPYPHVTANPVHEGVVSSRIAYLGAGYIAFFLASYGTVGKFWLAERFGDTWYSQTISGMLDTVQKMSANGKGVVLASNADVSWSAASPSYLARSANYGRSWAIQTFASSRSLPNFVWLDDDTVLMTRYEDAGTVTIVKSIDAGLTWVAKATGLGYPNAMFCNLGDGIIVCTDTGMYNYESNKQSFLRSDDYGETWTRISATVLWGYISSTMNLGNGHAILLTNNTKGYVTHDYGLTWALISGIDLSAGTGGCYYISTGVGFITRYGYASRYYLNKTVDYGYTWHEYTDPVISPGGLTYIQV